MLKMFFNLNTNFIGPEKSDLQIPQTWIQSTTKYGADAGPQYMISTTEAASDRRLVR